MIVYRIKQVKSGLYFDKQGLTDIGKFYKNKPTDKQIKCWTLSYYSWNNFNRNDWEVEKCEIVVLKEKE